MENMAPNPGTSQEWLNTCAFFSEKRKIKLYDALITSVLLYNCSSWAVPENILNKLDVQQRKHLKQIPKKSRKKSRKKIPEKSRTNT